MTSVQRFARLHKVSVAACSTQHPFTVVQACFARAAAGCSWSRPTIAVAGPQLPRNCCCTAHGLPWSRLAAMAMSSPTQGGGPSVAALQQWQQTIEAVEQQWGSSHPAVGRAWLELARALQAADKDSNRAKHATKKAFDICQILLQQTGTVSTRSCPAQATCCNTWSADACRLSAAFWTANYQSCCCCC